MKRSRWGNDGREELFETYAQNIKTSGDKALTSREVTGEFLTIIDDMSESSKMTYFKLLRRKILKVNPTIDVAILPKCPKEIHKEVKKQELERTAARFDEPIVLNTTTLLSFIIEGLKLGLEQKQCPKILFCLSYLVGLRPNDLNVLKVRQNGQQVTSEDIVLLQEDNVGTLVNLLPSKQQRKKGTIENYSTVIVCDPKDYPLVHAAIRFVLSEENKKIPCITTINDYKKGVASGPDISQKWGTVKRGITKHMLMNLRLNETVISWGNYSSGFTRQLGRSFVASLVEQGRFYLEEGLRPYKAVELTLGHEPLSSTNVNYLRIDCRFLQQVSGVTMKKVSTKNNLKNSNLCVNYGTCLYSNFE